MVVLRKVLLLTDCHANLGFLDTAYTSINPGAPLPKDSEFARAPETTYMLSAQYDWENVFGGSLMTRIQSNYWDSYWRASTLELRQNFQGLVSDSPAGDLMGNQCQGGLGSQ